jgi:hypothetical protein
MSDPFYCEGAVVKHLNSLGFQSVIHKNEDFWNHVQRKSVPDYDVLVTNPPFSGEHKVRGCFIIIVYGSHKVCVCVCVCFAYFMLFVYAYNLNTHTHTYNRKRFSSSV